MFTRHDASPGESAHRPTATAYNRNLAGHIQLLALLASGEPVSGAALATRMGLSREAVRQQIQALRARGVPVQTRRGAGYCLPWPLQMLDADRILAALPMECVRSLGQLQVHGELDSTSSEVQRRLATMADLGMVLAESQSAGRGRRGRDWLSPPGLNIYLSCLKRFEVGFGALSGLSLAVGVIVLRALDELGIAGAGLKWPNDVLAGRGNGVRGKLAGILVELCGEPRGPCAAIVGIGLNLRLTPTLHRQAGQPTCDLASLCAGGPPDRNQVAASLIAALVRGLREFESRGFEPFVGDYERHDVLRGELLQLSGALGQFEGAGAGIDVRGALKVRLPDGSVRHIDSAEVTVRRA